MSDHGATLPATSRWMKVGVKTVEKRISPSIMTTGSLPSPRFRKASTSGYFRYSGSRTSMYRKRTRWPNRRVSCLPKEMATSD